jgi:hypothetical protein
VETILFVVVTLGWFGTAQAVSIEPGTSWAVCNSARNMWRPDTPMCSRHRVYCHVLLPNDTTEMITAHYSKRSKMTWAEWFDWSPDTGCQGVPKAKAR